MKTQAERFWAKVDKTETCWNWTATAPNGYGWFFLYKQGGRKFSALAHRWSYEQLVGPIPDDLTLDHLCRNTRCVNPDHLEPVTLQVNISRTSKPTCVRGHPMSGENLYIRPDGQGIQCRECQVLRQRIRAAARGTAGAPAARTHCPRGHRYSDENTYLNRRGHRSCRACRRVSA